MKEFGLLLKETYQEWRKDNPMLLAAALSFFTVFSIIPILILAIALLGHILGEERAQQEIIKQLAVNFGPQAANSVRNLLGEAQASGAGVASLFSGVLLFVVGSRVFLQLQKALNLVWRVEQTKPRGVIKNILLKRLISFAMVIGVGLFIFAFFFVDVTLQTLSSSLGSAFPQIQGLPFWKLASYGGSLTLFTLLFAVLYKYVPEARVSWRDVWVGALVTSVLIASSRYLLTLYFRLSNVSSLYGAVGSMIIFLLWIYYTAQIFLFGAEFTWIYANRFGSRSQKK